jgi:hypothetical protein
LSIWRADPRFVLPNPVERAVVLGGLGGWLEGLGQAGVETTDRFTADSVPPLVVAPVELAGDAIASGAGSIILEGRGGASALRQAGFETQRLVPTPSISAPRHLVRVDHTRASVYAIEHSSAPASVKKRLRNTIAKAFLARGRFPEVVPIVTVGTRSVAPPFLVAEAARFGAPGDPEWFMTLGGGDALSRSVFHLFAPGENEPGWVVKFARVPGYTAPFERDERGLRLARTAGEAVGQRVPRILGRFEAAGLHASLEISARGYRLTDLLRRGLPRDEKVRVVDSVAAWILELGQRTAGDAGALAEERDRLAREVVPRWAGAAISPTLVESIPDIPSVVEHGDIGAWNVIARDTEEFFVIDWESVREHGFPLWDLTFFLADALLQLDGGDTEAAQNQHTAQLFRGEIPSSEILFRWIRAGVEAFGIPPDAVGSIVTLCWLHHGIADNLRGETRGTLGVGSRWGEVGAERIAGVWMNEPGLGPTWNSWCKN